MWYLTKNKCLLEKDVFIGLVLGLLACFAYADDAQGLVGKIIEPHIPFKKVGSIPGWRPLSSMYVVGAGQQAIISDDGCLDGSRYLVISKLEINGDKSALITDAKLIDKKCPLDRDGWLIGDRAEDTLPQELSIKCRSRSIGGQLIGFVKPAKEKNGCAHYSRLVTIAWRIDSVTHRLIGVPAGDIECRVGDDSECSWP